jgi:uncharacterized membrane protein
MSTLVDWAIPVAIGLVALVLVLGLINLLRRGSANLSQRLMRWRIGLQFFAVCLMMISLYLFR